MNALDFAILGIVFLSVVMGFWKGLVKEIFALVGVVLGVALALLLAPSLSGTLSRWIQVPSAAYAAALVIVFVGILILAAVVAHLLTKLLEIAKLDKVNRLLGGAFGVLRGGLIGLVVVLGLTLFLDEKAPLISGSKIAPVLASGARAIAPLLPEEPRKVLLQRLEDLRGNPETV